MRNQVMRHAFEKLPSTVLGTPLGQAVYSSLKKQQVVSTNRGSNFRRGTKGGVKS